MNGAVLSIAAAAAVLYLGWRTIAAALRFGPWMVPVVLVVDFVIVAASGSFFPLPLLLWKMLLLYTAARWGPLLNLFRLPAWPRVSYMRGPGRRRKRQFREPMPWFRGPCTW